MIRKTIENFRQKKERVAPPETARERTKNLTRGLASRTTSLDPMQGAAQVSASSDRIQQRMFQYADTIRESFEIEDTPEPEGIAPKELEGFGGNSSSSSSGVGTTGGEWGYDIPKELVDSLVNMESGGNYQAKGPPTKYGRALGFGQVLPENVVRWSKEIVGREVTPDEFIQNPDLQRRIVFGKLNQYWLKSGGNPKDVAAMWHSGRTYDSAVGRGLADVNMSTKKYADSIVSNYYSKIGRA